MKRPSAAALQGWYPGLTCDHRVFHVLVSAFVSMLRPSELPSRFYSQRFFGSCAHCRPVASAGIEHDGVAIFEGDFDRPAGFGALIERVGLSRLFSIGNPCSRCEPRTSVTN